MTVHEKLTAIADAIRDKTGGTEKLTLIQMAEAIPQIYDIAQKDRYDAFWDAFQLDRNTPTGHRLHYAYAFAYSGWTDANYQPKYPITPSNSSGIGSIFTWNVKVTDTKVPITAYGSCANAFANSGIVRIPKLIFNGTTNVSNMFLNCSKLEQLYCEGELAINGLNLQYSTKLNRESIECVIGVLSDSTTGLSITLSKEAVDTAFEGEGTAGTDSLAWTQLLETKPNWTVSLV